MNKIVLKATRREVIGKKVKILRREGKLPALLYGHGLESTPIVMGMHEASKILANVGSSTLISVELEGKEHAALVRERQIDVIYRHLIHVDFQALSLTETTTAQVPLVLGEESAPAIKAYSAVLLMGMDQVEIECLPQDLPESIVVDVTGLESIGDSVQVRDLIPPDGVKILGDMQAMVVVATAQMGEEEEDELELELELEDGTEPEVIEKGKGEEDEE
jgi:large subunit ribosomal protein L25